MEYPKINSLFKREPKGKRPLIMGDYSLQEFGLIKQWQVFEKIDGTNIRVTYTKEFQARSIGGRIEQGEYPTVRFEGRTKDSQIPCHLLAYLQDTFTVEKLSAAFPEAERIILYGEGHGQKIQAGGSYRDDVSFILFDVYAEDEWWLKYEDRLEICDKLDIEHVSQIGYFTEEEIVEYVRLKPPSMLAMKHTGKLFQAEGVVCVTEPLLRLRSGEPLKFKLRCEDFA